MKTWGWDIYRSAEEVVADRLQQGEDAETRGDGDHQGAGSLQGLCLLWFDFTQKSLEKDVTSSDLISWKRKGDWLKRCSFVYLCTRGAPSSAGGRWSWSTGSISSPCGQRWPSSWTAGCCSPRHPSPWRGWQNSSFPMYGEPYWLYAPHL